MDKQNVVYAYNLIVLNYKKEWSTDTCCHMDEPQKHDKWKKPEKVTYCTIPFIWKIQNRDREQIGGFQGLQVG